MRLLWYTSTVVLISLHKRVDYQGGTFMKKALWLAVAAFIATMMLSADLLARASNKRKASSTRISHIVEASDVWSTWEVQFATWNTTHDLLAFLKKSNLLSDVRLQILL